MELALLRFEVESGFVQGFEHSLYALPGCRCNQNASKNAVANMSRKGRSTSLIKCWKSTGVFVTPNGITGFE